MPRIRKKTTKRGTTHQRQKIKHKAAETRKKRTRESKKNPNAQWKSKNKDPGIPNNFPYKDQILAEVAEERRQAEEAKQLRKQQKKSAKAANEAGNASDDEDEGVFDGVTSVRATQMASGSKSTKGKVVASVEDAEVDEAPALLNNEFPDMKSVLEAADVVVEVLDARDPLAYHSTHLEELVKEKEGREILLVLNKIDVCPRESVSAWATTLRQQHPTVLFRSASAFLPALEPSSDKGKSKVRSDDAVGASVAISALQKIAEKKAGDEPLVVAVVGFTNSGKSSFINSLARKPALPTYKLISTQDGPSTSVFPQEVLIEVGGKKIRLVDTPGIVWAPSSDASPVDVARIRARDILVRNKGRIDRLKDPEPVVDDIVSRTSSQDLMLFYNLPAFGDKDSNGFLSALARANNLIKKGGVLDTVGACRILLRDWSTGKFPRYTLPASSGAATGDLQFSELYANDDKVLATLPTRKERRKTEGLAKLSASSTETRRIALEKPWVVQEESVEDDENEEVGDEEEVDEEEDEGEDESEDIGSVDSEEDEEDEEISVPPAGKRKRAAASKAASAPPPKRVAFAPEPKNTKQARSAAGARGSVKKDAKSTAAASRKSAVASAKPVPARKVANAAPAKKAVAAAAGGEEAYDFKSFF